jgi:hypothetical protein
MYVVIDTISRNVLGEFDHVTQARTFFLDLVAADPTVATHLKILSKTGEKKTVSPQSVREAASRAPVSA